MLVPSTSFSAITGKAAPAQYEELEARVVVRLSALLDRDLVADFDEATVPTTLAHAIAWGVATLASPQQPALPAGVSSINVAGEYSTVMAFGYTTAADGTALPIRFTAFADLGGQCVTMALRHRRVAL